MSCSSNVWSTSRTGSRRVLVVNLGEICVWGVSREKLRWELKRESRRQLGICAVP